MTQSYFENVEVNAKMFNETNSKLRRELMNSRFEDGEKFEYGYAITTHLSQGSSWKKVLFYYEPYGDKMMRRQLPYTGITRAEELLILAM
jgi:exodeoxyribonuclease-5